MKKLITVILILTLLLPVISLAETTGAWLSMDILETGAPTMTWLYLADGGTCYFVIQAFHPDEPGLGRQFVGTWHETSGGVWAKTGNNTDTTLKIYGDYAMDTETGNIFLYVPVITLRDLVGEN